VFSPDGTRLATGSADGTARLWDVDSGKELAVLRHGEQVWTVAFSPYGRRLATGGYDGTARLWDADSGRELAVLRHGGPVYAVVFGPYGMRLATGSEDGTARLWRVRIEDLEALACDFVSRNLTKDEWQQYLGDRPYRPTCPDLPLYSSVTRSLLVEGIGLASEGDVEGALARFDQALELDPSLEIDAQTWVSFCWFGSLWGRAADVLPACQQAVALAPDHGGIRDSRGLARALTGDFEGAIGDFEFYVDWLKRMDSYEAGGNGREAWIAELEAGRNPFDEATLKALREP
jgi:tetratricopeptide (TPR) repeat protein